MLTMLLVTVRHASSHNYLEPHRFYPVSVAVI
jgi:hypothetical protein